MTTDKEQYDLSDKYGVPKKFVSCPSCGDTYGTAGRMVCTKCEECTKCCQCKKPKPIDAEEFIENYMDI